MADIYHIWADHKQDVDPYDFANKMRKFLDGLVSMGRMKGYRLTRSKLGFRSMDMPEFRIDMEFDNMQQLDDAMTVTIHDKDVDKVHVGFNQFVNVDTIQHFLYRDFPDVPPADLNTSTLTEQQKSYTIEEIVQATKDIESDIWKK